MPEENQPTRDEEQAETQAGSVTYLDQALWRQTVHQLETGDTDVGIGRTTDKKRIVSRTQSSGGVARDLVGLKSVIQNRSRQDGDKRRHANYGAISRDDRTKIRFLLSASLSGTR